MMANARIVGITAVAALIAGGFMASAHGEQIEIRHRPHPDPVAVDPEIRRRPVSAKQGRNKYTPHQGAREIARRRKKMGIAND
ncbi:MAG: hypothetical protein Q7S99_03175 [Parvibaculum sp.]|nr:hypothetical protein [Parvibaculum sp.]